MRVWPVVLAALVIGGCSSDPSSVGMMKSVARLSNALLSVPARYQALVAERAPKIDVSVEARRTAAAYRLAGTRSGHETWLGSDGVSLAFREGILVETRGMGGDLMASDVSDLAPLVLGKITGTAHRTVDILDGSDQIRSLAFSCQISLRGTREIDGVTADLVSEECIDDTSRFINLYWLVGGRVIQSRQWAGPFTGTLAIRTAAP